MKTIDIVYFIVLAFLLVLSSLLSAADMAYSAVSRVRLEWDASRGDARSASALDLAANYDKTIATILFGNDLVNILSSSLATLLGYDLLSSQMGEESAALVASLSVLAVIVIFGDLIPKSLAKAHSRAAARHLARFVKSCQFIFFPFVWPTTKLAQKFASPLIDKVPPENDFASDEELQAMIKDIEKEGLIDSDKSELLNRTIEFKETACHEIMTPRVKVVAYDIETPFASFLKRDDAFKHSRIPVYKENFDHVLGYIPVKGLLRLLVQGENPDPHDLIVPIISVPRTMNISSVMALMKESHRHVAIVKDEFGGSEGLLTLEDILEELVGDMWDESEPIQKDVVTAGEKNVFFVLGKMNIKDFFKRFRLHSGGFGNDYSTVSGWLTDRLGRFAKVGDTITYEKITVVVTKASSYAVEQLKVVYQPSRKENAKGAKVAR
jgi:putative hemolysin